MRLPILVSLFFGLVLSASADVPHQLHYNGYLTNAVGEAVDCPDPVQCTDVYEFTLRLYSNEEATSPVWSEESVGIALYQGSFHIVMGDGVPLTSDIFEHENLWLGIKVNNMPEMLPRQRVLSAAFAIRSGSAANATNAEQLGGLPPSDYATQDALTELEVIIDGNDNDTLAGLACAEGQVAQQIGGSWGCADPASGPQGIAGPEGPEGPQGIAGVAGPEGPQGIAGLAGPKGDTGDTGPAGADSTVAGPQGPQGIPGVPGADSTVAGPQGPQGIAGVAGPEGPQGIPGVGSNFTVMTLKNYNSTPDCPPDWTSIHSDYEWSSDTKLNHIRTCTIDQDCKVAHLVGYNSQPICPPSWVTASDGYSWASDTKLNYLRTCISCP